MKEYKVITQNDKWFSGRFDGAALQQLLNQEAKLGWEVKSMTSASREGVLMGGNKDELIVLLVRDLVPVAPKSTETAAVAAPNHSNRPAFRPAEEEARAASRQAELDRKIAMIEATVSDPTERQRLKLRAISEAY